MPGLHMLTAGLARSLARTQAERHAGGCWPSTTSTLLDAWPGRRLVPRAIPRRSSAASDPEWA